ncbi:beta-galactosidase [Actinoplanes teichomyceticus]|uniref:Beta-galactosidase n=1 Tax=Actinoplanes teichomyceticus TaxID=1867 RepID=A0A561VGB3_ACTTI|nr:beta-galactosidase [Actinoplanes teichomyceticus]TWG10641.1 beta-galactosidase [Actinoplanes teichomyceticus]GIF15410.1 beta-galactosidase [Actinoplanes teichomyceticus]
MLFFGGDYNPEQWPEEVWEQDVALMRRAGVTIVSLGVFAWSHLEPEEGRFEFGWLDRIMDRLHEGGIRVALATPTASPPPWFTLAHPEGLPVTADGVRLSHGSRDTYCVSAPAYRAAARRIAAALAGRYAGHPALALWHVHNEYGTDCRCDLTAAAFRVWLRDKHGGLDALNDAWTTAFWSQRYSDWAQILPPRATRYLPNPAHVLDFRRFLSDELLGAFVEQRDLLRAATPDIPVTTNFVQGGWVSVDHARWAAELDVVAVDHYPATTDGAEAETAFGADLARGWAAGQGGSWLLMETAPNLIYTPGRMHAKEPGRLTRHSLSYLARGSRGAMYFQWRQPRGGAELFHSALVPHAGPDSPVFREAVGLGRTLKALDGQVAGPLTAQVAIGWDAPSWWALQGGGLPAADIDYPAAVQQTHRALYHAGIATDFVFPGLDGLGERLRAYRMVVLPHLYLVSDEAAAALREFVASGGHLVAGHLSGIADPAGRIRLGGYPGAFRDFLGVRVVEWRPLAPGTTIALDNGDRGVRWSERVETAGAETVVRYAADVLAGAPAITRNRYGDGAAWYVSPGLDDDALRRLLDQVAAEAGVLPVLPGLPPRLDAVRRGDLVFLFNHGDAPAPVPLPGPGTDAVTGRPAPGSVTVPAGGTTVVALQPPDRRPAAAGPHL